MDSLASGEEKTLRKRFVEQSLWLEVQFRQTNTLLAMADKMEETSRTSNQYYAEKSSSWT